MGNLLRHLTARSWLFFAVSAGLLAAFEYLVCAIVSTINITGAIEEVMRSAPPLFSSVIGDQLAGLNTRGILAFGWNHPVAHAAGLAVAIVFGARAIAGEIDQGSVEMLLSQPLSRARYYSTQLLFGVTALAVLALAGLAGTFLGQHVFDVESFGKRDLLELGLNYWLLQLAWFGIALALSSFGRESGRVATVAFFIALLSYLVRAIGTIWDRAAFALPYSLHSYYSPQEILVEQRLDVSSLTVLVVVALTSIALGAWHFHRRDLP